MKRLFNALVSGRIISVVLGVAALAFVVSLGAVSQAADGERATYEVDGVHSTIIYRISHLGVANFHGAFPIVNGSYTIDHSNPSKSTFAFTVPTERIESFNEQRNNHLKSGDFFNVREYPEITFQSTKVEQTGDHQFKVTADLTMLGETHPVTVDVKMHPEKNAGPRFGTRSGLDATFTIKRSKWGMNTYVEEGALGDEVTLMVGIEGVKQ